MVRGVFIMSADDKIIALFQQTKSYSPSKALDQKILLAAKHKIAKPKPNHKRLIWGLSSVAVVVLSVNIALKLVIEPTQSPLTIQQPSLEIPSSSIQNDVVADEKFNSRPFTQADALKESEPVSSKQSIKKSLAKKEQRLYSETQLLDSESVANPSFSQAMKTPKTKSLDIPLFSFDLEKLKQSFGQLTIKQISPDIIHINNNERLILTLHREKNADVFITAFPQKNELNLNIDWSLSPTQLQQCVTQENTIKCRLNSKQTAHFKNSSLVKVTWVNN